MIYDLDKKKFSEKLIEFNKTYYGKCIFVICYSLFIILFLTVIINFLFKLSSIELMFKLLILCLISFVVGSYGFYKELRIFVNKKDNH
ncbi:MAG: hypothetical protein IKR57_04985 [Bacilli bacterium]|nr:hypothetical protein [Bacilli bacterium]